MLLSTHDTLVVQHRVTTHFGQEYARLSRDQAILVSEYHESRWIGFLTSSVSLRGSETIKDSLNDLFVDELLYIDQWRPFMKVCLCGWRRVSKMVSLIEGLFTPNS